MAKYVKLFGIGEKTGIELRREVSGLMPTSEWKKAQLGEEWQPGENLSNAIGQGFVLTTPIQLAVGYNTIGQNGKLFKPLLVKRIIDPAGRVTFEGQSTLVRDLTQTQPNGVHVDVENIAVVREGLRRVFSGDHGTARGSRLPGMEMAGKTGTSQVVSFSADQIYNKCDLNPLEIRHHGWFVAFAPAQNPEITVAMLAEHGCSGARAAAPIVKEVMKAYFDKYHPGLIEENLKKQRLAQQRSGGNSGAGEVEGE
jgi:penicillin-binding protein 2